MSKEQQVITELRSACHAGGREFESRPDRKSASR